jgi:hypothetical protein
MLINLQNEYGKAYGDLIERIVAYADVIDGSKGKDGKVLLIITGEPGMGKSTVIQNTLGSKLDRDSTGMVTDKKFKNTNDFYKYLFDFNDRFLIMNDTDSLIRKNSKFRGMMVGAFNTRQVDREVLPEEDRKDNEIAWTIAGEDEKSKKRTTKKQSGDKGLYPAKFKFTGAMVFTTNLPIDKIDSAILDRAFVVDFSIDKEGVLDEIIRRQGSNRILADYSAESKSFVIKFLQERIDSIERLDFRAYVALVQIKENSPAMFNFLAVDIMKSYGMKV